MIDPESARVVADIPVGFFPHGIVASAERVWALNVEDDTASAVDPRTLRVVRTFGLQGIPSDQWASGNIDWVAESGSVQRLSQTLPSRADVKTIKLWKPSSSSDCGATVTGTPGTPGTVWVSERRHFAEIDGETGTVRRRLVLPSVKSVLPTCYLVRYRDGELYAGRYPDTTIGSLDPRTGQFEPLLSVSKLSDGRGWDIGNGTIWAATAEE